MAVAAGVPGASMIAAYLRSGAPVFGEAPPIGLYASEHSVPDKTLEQVPAAAKWSKPVLRARTKGGVNPEVDDE
eukprot:11226072-Lingulodinium_polyedra.AAC.1